MVDTKLDGSEWLTLVSAQEIYTCLTGWAKITTPASIDVWCKII